MGVWDVVGWTGNALFFSRFFVEWIASERAKRSVAPRAFWWLSLVATILFALYTNAIGQPFLTGAFAINTAIYSRNLFVSR
ncbi:MAG: lipid-A-disaccharide synthase N-terminal domain-containing protein, partial [Myxococcales bacterium]|nr:lipid-A-disaccharide synthase N-terminal domain-containing protein [Myxococcales bacterium]